MLAWLKSQPVERVDPPLLARLKGEFPGAGERSVRAVLDASGLALSPLVEGVRQDTFEHLERTLVALAAEYEKGDRCARQRIRRRVIVSKQHATLAARNPKLDGARRSVKLEMRLWLLTWLENPPLFPVWATLRKRTCFRADDAL